MYADPPLTTNRVLNWLPAELAHRLMAQMRVEPMQLGHSFAEPGERFASVSFVLSGAISLVTVLADGETVEAGMVGREGMLGASGVLSGLPTFTRAICQVTGEVGSIDGRLFREWAGHEPALRQAVDRYVEGTANQAQQSIACRAWHNIEQRFCRWLLTACDHAGRTEIELTQEFMAQMLGVQRQTVSAVASGLKAEGLIHYARGRISVRDVAPIEQRTCECLRAMRGRWDALWALG